MKLKIKKSIKIKKKLLSNQQRKIKNLVSQVIFVKNKQKIREKHGKSNKFLNHPNGKTLNQKLKLWLNMIDRFIKWKFFKLNMMHINNK